MSNQLLFIGIFLFLFSNVLVGQTEEELKAQKGEKEGQIAELESQIAGLKGEVSAIDAQLVTFPRWEKGSFGIIGANFSGFNDWLSKDQPNTVSNSISFSGNVFANHFQEKFFWRNAANLNIGYAKVTDRKDKDNDNDDEDTETRTPDVINFTSLLGLNLTDKLAASTLLEYRSTFLENFNNPGYLDIGVGFTWTPVTDLVVVAHPLNYNFVFAEDDDNFTSSLGAKIVADYTRKLTEGVNWKSNLSLFLSYKDLEELSNWTWINGLSVSVLKNFGVGFELGLRNNKQELNAYNARVLGDPNIGLPELSDNPLQLYYIFGITYTL